MIAVENGRLPVAEGFERLMRLGYSEDDARLLMQEAESKLGDTSPRRFGTPASPSADGLRARAREVLGSDRVIDELLEVLQFGRSLSRQGEKDLRLLFRLYPLSEARTFDEWLAALRVILTGDLQGLRIPSQRTPQGFRREIRRVRPLR